MKKCLAIILCLFLSGCSVEPRENMRMDFGCRVVRNPKSEKIEHFHCDKKYPVQFQWRF